MIAGMVQGYLNPSLGEIFQELLCRLGIYSKFTKFTWICWIFWIFHLFLSISKYLQSMALFSQVNCKAIDSADL